jgi:hypothetical protein
MSEQGPNSFDMTAFAPSPLNGRPGRRTRVAIVGALDSKVRTPWEDPTWDVWGMNLIETLDRRCRFRADAWFDMHQLSAQSESDIVWLRKCPVPLYVPDAEMAALNPKAVVFPLATIELATGKNYWACSFAYQLALAWRLGFKEVGLFGIDLSRGTLRERTVEWACASWWAGFLEGQGVTVSVPPGVRFGLHDARYGVEYEAERLAVERYDAGTVEAALWHIQQDGGKVLVKDEPGEPTEEEWRDA